jgi:excisionase family DNA binding protein
MRNTAGLDDGGLSETRLGSGRQRRSDGLARAESRLAGARLGAEEAAAEAGVSVDTIRRAYRSGALRAFRPGGARRIVIRLEDLHAWAFGEERAVSPVRSPAQLRPPVDQPAVASHGPARQHSRRVSAAGSVERLREIERSE